MYLAFKDLAGLFSDFRGLQDESFLFHTVTDHANSLQPKGLFIPLNEESGELSDAIRSGAIAAIWDVEKKLPRYIPTYFPVFLTSDPSEAAKKVLQFYIEKLDGEPDIKMEITKFNFITNKLLNKNNQTYDIAGMLKTLTNSGSNERRG